jgi:prepilin-type N-terminal cleavage/methylation domain-containing protein
LTISRQNEVFNLKRTIVAYKISTNLWKQSKQREADLNTERRNQGGVTLVELLVVVAILGILGGITGLFLLKYLPEYNLRSATSAITQNARMTQSNALKGIRPWYIQFTTATQSYSVFDSGPDGTVGTGDDIAVKRIELQRYGGGVQFDSGPSGEAVLTGLSASRAIFTPDGNIVSSGAIRLANSRNTTYRINFARAGTVRSFKWEGAWK